MKSKILDTLAKLGNFFRCCLDTSEKKDDRFPEEAGRPFETLAALVPQEFGQPSRRAVIFGPLRSVLQTNFARSSLIILSSMVLLAMFGMASAENAPAPQKPAPAPTGKDKLAKQFSSSDKPVQIEADNMVVYRNEFKIVFTNRVVLKQAPTVIQTNKLTAYYREKDWEVTKAICEGDVRIRREKTFAKCGRATYDNVKSIIIMELNPVIYQENNIFRGKILHYYMNEERITGTDVRFQRNPEPPAAAPKAP